MIWQELKRVVRAGKPHLRLWISEYPPVQDA